MAVKTKAARQLGTGGGPKLTEAKIIIPQTWPCNQLVTDPLEYAHILHGDADGWVTLAAKDPDWSQRHHQAAKIPEVLRGWNRPNSYISANTSYRPQKGVAYVRQLRTLYQDVDCYRLGLDPWWVAGKILYEEVQETIPEPNLIVYSGRGLQLVWLIDPVPFKGQGGKVYRLWHNVQRHLYQSLKHLGADKAIDAARMIRLAGTINTKAGALAVADYRHPYRYDLGWIAEDYLPELPNRVGKSQGRRVGRPKSLPSLLAARVRDLRLLVEMRDGWLLGHRNNLIYIYSLHWYLLDPDRAEDEVWDLAARLRPPLRTSEVLASLRSAATRSQDPDWKIESNETIIEKLGIGPEEQAAMETIHGREEHARRERERKRRERGGVSREEYEASRQADKAAKLELLRQAMTANPGASVRKLAELTGLSKSTVDRLRREL